MPKRMTITNLKTVQKAKEKLFRNIYCYSISVKLQKPEVGQEDVEEFSEIFGDVMTMTNEVEFYGVQNSALLEGLRNPTDRVVSLNCIDFTAFRDQRVFTEMIDLISKASEGTIGYKIKQSLGAITFSHGDLGRATLNSVKDLFP